jgi:predicted transcriptional regulator
MATIVNIQDYKHVNAFVHPDVRRELERLARAGDRSLSAEIRRALDAHVGRDETEEEET